MTTELVRYDAMCRAISEAHSVDEVKDIRDKALALEAYARQALNTDAEREACEIRLRAERKVGQLLRGTPKQHGARGIGKKVESSDTTPPPPTLADLGISKDQSSKWQKLADMPDDDFDRAIGVKTSMPSTNGLLREMSPQRFTVSPHALWVWGRLRDFERDGLLGRSPGDVMETMTDQMKDDVHELAPRVSAWLERIGEMP